MSLPVPRRKVAALALATAGLATVLAGAFAPAAQAAPASSERAAAKASDWFKDPRTPAQRKAQVAVPKKPGAYKGKVRETRAVYRTKAGALAVPMRYAFGHTVQKGQAVTLDGNGLFVVNTTALTTSATTQIRKLAIALENASSVRCEGYADYAGAAKRNNVLARDRAARVCDFLVSVNKGLTATTVSYGPTWPAVIGGDSEARKLNRRVVVEMTGTKPVAPQAQVPGPPVLEDVNGYHTNAYFAWSAPLDDGGSPITGYQVTTGDGWAPVNMQLPRAAAKKSLCRGDCGDFLYGFVEGLTPGSTVDLRVRAVNAIGAGAPSNTLSTVVYDVPGAPTGLDYVTDGGDLAVHFGAPATTGGLPVTGYQISYDGGLTYDSLELSGNGPWTVVEHDLAIGETYAVRVRAGNDQGWGEPAAVEALITAKPSAPTLGEYDLDGTSLTFVFDAPGSAGGLTITSYEATVDGGETWQVVEPTSVGNGPLTFSVAGLTYGTTYDVALRAVNARGKGPWSNEVSALVSTVPDAPTTVVATADGTDVTVTFVAPAFDGGSEITGYQVRVDDGDWEDVELASSSLSFTLVDQKPGTHVYAVRAVNARGESASASSQEVEVDLGPPAVQSHDPYPWTDRIQIAWYANNAGALDVTEWQIRLDGGAWQTLDVYMSEDNLRVARLMMDCDGVVCANLLKTAEIRGVVAGGFTETSAVYYFHPQGEEPVGEGIPGGDPR